MRSSFSPGSTIDLGYASGYSAAGGAGITGDGVRLINISYILLIILIAGIILSGGCLQKDIKTEEIEKFEVGDMRLTSTVFDYGGRIPQKYTCDGEDINPPLVIEDVPADAKTLVLIVDDPDAPMGTWDHWIVWNIPVIDRIEEDSVPGTVGVNSWGRNDYGGPCPPSGEHRYFFKLYALDTTLNLDTNSTKKDLERAMEGHVIAQTDLIGVYSRA